MKGILATWMFLLLAGCSGPMNVPSPSPIPPVKSGIENLSLVNTAWNFLFEMGPSVIHPNSAAVGLEFSLPLDNPALATTDDPFAINYGSVHYLLTLYSSPLKIGDSLSFTANMTMTDGTTFNFAQAGNLAGLPANCRFMIVGNSTNGTALTSESWQNPDYRWWPNTSWMVLQAGQQTLTVSLDPAVWNNVNGVIAASTPPELATFQAAIANPLYLGITFGGGSFDGHGVNVVGSATFNMTHFQVVHQ